MALKDIDKAISLNGDISSLYKVRGDIYLGLRKYDLAIADLNIAILQDNKSSEAYAVRGICFVKKKDHKQAIDDFSRAIGLDSKRSEFYAFRAQAYYEIGLWDKSETDYEESLKRNPDNALARYYLGLDLMGLKQPTQAIEEISKSIELNPNSADSYFQRGYIRSSLGDLQGSINDNAKAIERDPLYADAYFNRGNAYNGQGNYQRAIADYTKAISIDDKHPEYFNNRGNARKSLKQFDRAISDYNSAIKLNSSWYWAYNSLADIYATCPMAGLRNGKLAVEYATKAEELCDWNRLFYMSTLADAYAEDEDWDQAIIWEKRYLSTNLNATNAAKAKAKLEKYIIHINPNHSDERQGQAAK